jgi:hypothetical protein
MADDYGALVLIEAEGPLAGDVEPQEYIRVEVLDARFVEGRSFELARPSGV